MIGQVQKPIDEILAMLDGKQKIILFNKAAVLSTSRDHYLGTALRYGDNQDKIH